MTRPVDRTNLEVPMSALDELRAAEGIVPRVVEEAFNELDRRLKRLERAAAPEPVPAMTSREREDALAILRLATALHHVMGILEQESSHASSKALPIIRAALEGREAQ